MDWLAPSSRCHCEHDYTPPERTRPATPEERTLTDLMRRVETLEAQLKQLTASLCETRRVLDEARRAVR